MGWRKAGLGKPLALEADEGHPVWMADGPGTRERSAAARKWQQKQGQVTATVSGLAKSQDQPDE